MLWIQGRRVSGPVLGWLTYSRPTANADGFWQGTHLPAASVRVLAFSRTLHEQALGGAFDGLAVEIPYPWNQDAEVPAIE
ncbi:MAG: hypothetical protein GY856_17315 [bacterium]|nr:hypothetical protein [bacterium]